MAQVPNKLNLKKILFKLIAILLIANTAAVADKHENFEFMDQTVTFKKKTRSGFCSEEIFYPELFLKNDQILADKMNGEIDKIIRAHKMCNSKSENQQYNTTYEIIKASDDIMSIKWTTKSGDKIMHIDAINFMVENGEVVSIKQVLEPLIKDFMVRMIKLSDNHLPEDTNWTDFLTKVEQRDIQYYMDNSQWYLVFNSDINSDKQPFIVKIPEVFFKAKSQI